MNNPEYIKMVLALPDKFFAGWEWEYGDCIIVKVPGGWGVHWIGDFEIEDGELGNYYPIGGCESNFLKIDEYVRPLPSQEQLQKMLLTQPHKNYEFNDLYGLVYWFNKWFFKSDELYCMSFHDECKDFGQAFLCFTVEVLYSMAWDGEKWILYDALRGD